MEEEQHSSPITCISSSTEVENIIEEFTNQLQEIYGSMSAEFRDIFAEMEAIQTTLLEQLNTDVQLNKEMNGNLQAIERMVVGTISAMQRTLKMAGFSLPKDTM